VKCGEIGGKIGEVLSDLTPQWNRS